MIITRIILALLLLSMGLSCVNRTTNKEKEIETEAADREITPNSMYQTSGDANEGRTEAEKEIISKAESTVKNFFEALNAKEMEKAYNIMSAENSNRGTLDSFQERYSYETISLDIIGSAEDVSMDPARVKLPVRYTAKEKGTDVAYNGTITLQTSASPDSELRIVTISMQKE